MSWWGKLAGGALGFVVGGPIGAMLGAVVGHQLDRGLDVAAQHDALGWQGAGNTAQQERMQTVFFTTVFSVMGHLAKADGHVSESEIQLARNIMHQMHLNADQQKFAIQLFNKGKEPDFPLDEVIAQFHRECGRNRNLKQMFLEILLHAAYADGIMHDAERHLFVHICRQLGYSQTEFSMLEGMVRAQRAFHGRSYQEPVRPNKDLLQEAYTALGVKADAGDDEIKRAYRRLMSQHHPDKLVAKGLPEEMIKLANERTAEIKAAYETIRKARGMK
ncbi:MAG: co-chaperone DjlA [Gammaproteobacteria bacterium]|jgi:DnaJ like chaperone protein